MHFFFIEDRSFSIFMDLVWYYSIHYYFFYISIITMSNQMAMTEIR